jgi:hypothetical protein
MGRRYALLPANALPFEKRDHAIDPIQARWTVPNLIRNTNGRFALIELLNEIGEAHLQWSRTTDAAILRMVERNLDSGRLVVLPSDGSALAEGRQSQSKESAIASAVMGDAPDLVFDGQHLRVIPTQEWARLRERGGFQVVSKDKALPLLDRLAAAPATAVTRKKALNDAKPLLVDRIPPGKAHGLLLVRLTPTAAVAAREAEAPLTPSQLAKLGPKAPEKQDILSIVLIHRYHDDDPIQGAEFELEFSNGAVIKGALGANGMATVNDVPEEEAVVRFGPDTRPYQPVPQPKNPTAKPTMTDADFNALTDRYLSEPS